MKVFIMHVGRKGSIDLDFTVTEKRSISEMITKLSPKAPERKFFEGNELSTAFPSGQFNCWGVPAGAKALPGQNPRVFDRTQKGDLVFFVPEIGMEGGVEYIGIVKAVCRIESLEASRILWPKTPDERLFPWLFFFDTEDIKIKWHDFLNDIGYASNWNPKGYYKSISDSKLSRYGGAQSFLRHIKAKYKLL